MGRGANGNNGSKWIRKERRLALYLRDRFECGYCGSDLHGAQPAEVTLDHLEPRSTGGDNSNQNLTTACLTCNSTRGDRDWREYATGGAVLRIERRVKAEVPMALAKAIIRGEAPDPRHESR